MSSFLIKSALWVSTHESLCRCGLKREITVLLRGIVNHSYGKLQRNSDWNESLINSDWNESLINIEWNESLIEHKRLRDTNRYEVLEKYDEVENEVEIGTKVQFE